MQTKQFEIRDSATFIPALAIAIDGTDGWLARAAGYGGRCIALTRLQFRDARITYDEYDWQDRTMGTAHRYISEHWDELVGGEVIDVEFILGETMEKKVSEKETYEHYDY